VGDKLTREEVMQRLGIKNFKLDPPRPDFIEMHPQIEKYRALRPELLAAAVRHR
jgi:hypothetical protein